MNQKDYKEIAGIMQKNLIEDVDLGFKEGRQNCFDDKIIKDLADYFEKKLEYLYYNKVYDRKIKVKCSTCSFIYTKWADEKLNYTVDGSQCKCKPNFIVIEEIKFNKTQFLKDCGVEK